MAGMSKTDKDRYDKPHNVLILSLAPDSDTPLS